MKCRPPGFPGTGAPSARGLERQDEYDVHREEDCQRQTRPSLTHLRSLRPVSVREKSFWYDLYILGTRGPYFGRAEGGSAQ